MSKMDNLRAMREARYEQAMKRAGGATGATGRAAARPPVAPPARSDGTEAAETGTTRSKPAARKTTAKKAAAGKPASASAAEPGDALCGHRNMSGRSCTRPQGHSEKSHRYS